MPLNLYAFCKDLVYQATAPMEQLIADLDQICNFDCRVERQKAVFDRLSIASLVAVIVAVVVFLAFGRAFIIHPESIPQPLQGFPFDRFVLVLLLVFSAVAIFSKVLSFLCEYFDPVNYRYELTQRLLAMLNRDAAPDINYDLKVVLSKPNSGKKKIQTIPHPNHPGWKLAQFRDPWLALQGEFLDGTHFLVTIVEFYQTAYGWKQGRSGKNKYKTKSKSKGLEIQISLSYPRRKYTTVQVLQQDAKAAIQLSTSAILQDFKITNKGMQLSVKQLTNTTAFSSQYVTKEVYQTVMMMFLSLYQILNLARLLSSQKEG